MVKLPEYKNVLKELYTDTCTIYVTLDVETPNGNIEQSKEILYENIPCRLSFSSSKTTSDDEISTFNQQIKLFLDNTFNVLAGSEIIINRNNTLSTYEYSSKPMVFYGHQEILLKEMDYA